MLPPTPFSTTHTSHSLLGSFYHSRRLLQPHNTPLSMALPPSSSGLVSSDSYTGKSSFDANVIMILAVLLCALICALGLNSIIRCALRCSNRPAFDSGAHVSDRLANTGINQKVLKAFPTLTYSSDGLKLPGFDSRCAICLSEFADGEQVRVLPSCNHGFHVRCIDKWLVSHSSCPTCRQCLHNACQKLVACSPACPSVLPAPLQPVLSPMEPERLIINYTM